MKSWDVVIVGGGIIGLSLALSLRKHGAEILLVDKEEPGREASHAAAGMIAWCEQREELRDLATASARLYPEFIHELQDESGVHIDYRPQGTILFLTGAEEDFEPLYEGARRLEGSELAALEPNLELPSAGAVFLPEACLDPRNLVAAARKAARHRGIEIASGTTVTSIECSNLGVSAVVTTKTRFPAATVVNCAGAWAAQISGPVTIPTRPVKGHMLSVIPAARILDRTARSGSAQSLLTHVVHAPDVYLVPRSDGRIVIGSTVEEAGFDKRVNPDIIQHLHQAAANVLPQLGEAQMHESWVGLRPGSPDDLPILGATEVDNYFVATGHYRDGILLTPITAHLMTQVVRGEEPDFDLSHFAPARFAKAA